MGLHEISAIEPSVLLIRWGDDVANIFAFTKETPPPPHTQSEATQRPTQRPCDGNNRTNLSRNRQDVHEAGKGFAEHQSHPVICRGDEVDKIMAFKDALGLAPEDAAAAHMDVGRRFQRLANESSKSQQSEYRKVGFSGRRLFLPSTSLMRVH